jgi:transposase
MLYAQVNQTARKTLNQALKTVQNVKWYRRLKVIDLSARRQKVSEIAAIFDLSDHTVRGYINRYNEAGLEGLKANYGQGRNKTITLSKDEFSELLRRSPSQFEKLETGARNWNQALMKQYLWHYHQIKVSQSAISGMFKRLGLPWNRAKKKQPHLTRFTRSKDNGWNS